MKKEILIVIVICLNILSVFGQEYLFTGSAQFDYKIEVDYEISKDTTIYMYDEYLRCFKKTDNFLKEVQILNKSEYFVSIGFNMLRVNENKYVDTLDYKIKDNSQFPVFVIYSSALGNPNPRWVPLWYFEALKKKNRDLIIKAEPKRLECAADILPDVWYKDIPQVASVVLSNTGMTFYTPLETKLTGFLFGELKQINETTYETTAYPELQDTNELISWEPYKQNFPLLAEGNPVQFRYEIIGKTMKIYNAANNKIVFDLIQMPYEWVKLYEEFIRTNKVPVGLNIPEEYQKQ